MRASPSLRISLLAHCPFPVLEYEFREIGTPPQSRCLDGTTKPRSPTERPPAPLGFASEVGTCGSLGLVLTQDWLNALASPEELSAVQ